MNDDEALANSILNKALSKRKRRNKERGHPSPSQKSKIQSAIERITPTIIVSEPFTNC
jgi:hypothetical protein